MFVVRTILEIFYLMVLFGLAIYGLNNAITIILYLRKRNQVTRPTPMAELPSITVQLPIFNERYTVERLLNAIVALDYPREKLQIQLLDDSTDDTAKLVRTLVKQYQERGNNIELIQRANRHGYKAGALAEGMQTASGELLAIFDADFIPKPDWLKKTVIHFSDPALACLQTRWGHTNQDYSWFTDAQSLGIDGHFIIEQTARSRNGLFLNFNGTAGLWRRAAIEDAGGWQPDTLTEDLDLSYRVQMKGWHIGYLPDVVVEAELPAQVEAFKKQQYRWAKGSFQVVRKLSAHLMSEEMPETKRLLGFIHITGYFVHPLMVLTLLLILPVGIMAPEVMRMFPWTIISAFGPPLLYLVAKSDYKPHLMDRLRLLPVLVLIGFGLSLNNTIAVLQGIFSKDMGTFVRTPKFNLIQRSDSWNQNHYVMAISPVVWGEIALALYALMSIIILLPTFGWGVAPWLLVYVFGYAYIAGLNLYQYWQSSQIRLEKVSAA